MIREFAVDPSVVCGNLEILQRFVSDFGGGEGRVIGAIPHQWFREMQDKIRGLKLGASKQRICFDSIKLIAENAVVPRDGKSVGSEGWLNKAVRLHAEIPFCGIFTNQEDVEISVYNYEERLFSCPADWTVESPQSVFREANALAAVIREALILAPRPVHFVDKYFDPLSYKYFTPMIKFIELVALSRFGVKKIFIHTALQVNVNGRNKGRAEIERGLNENIKPRLPRGFEVELWVWDPNKMHDRFVLTNQFGFSFGHGLNEDQYQGALHVNVHRLGSASHKEEYRKFSKEADRDGDSILVTGGT